MNLMKRNRSARRRRYFHPRRGWATVLGVWLLGGGLVRAETAPPAAPHFPVTGYKVVGGLVLPADIQANLFSKYTGPNVSLAEVLLAATDLHYEFCKWGQAQTSIAISRDQLTNGLITLNVFKTEIPQVVVSGDCYLRFTNSPAAASASAGEIASARACLLQTLAELSAREAEVKAAQTDSRVHVVSTNAGPRFAVSKYLIAGNSVLPPQTLSTVLTNIDGAFGTNVSLEGPLTVAAELQRAYRERGYVTMAVTVPGQKLTNETVKVQVTEGRLAAINVIGNRYFSSNNVLRALPSLHHGILLNGPVLQAELNVANANRDRQISPVILPGPDPGTSALKLKVDDQLPVHGKLEFNNQYSPGTPQTRVSASAEVDNLWQYEHSLGVQYGFSPEQFKPGAWDFYDRPAVANYSAFYRLPLGNAERVSDVIANNPGNFGYNEATRKFNLPAPTGRPELSVFASQSTIDTGVADLSRTTLYDDGAGNRLEQAVKHQDTTKNTDLGARLSAPLPAWGNFQSTLSGGFDFKQYQLRSGETNVFLLTSAEINYNTTPVSTNIVTSTNFSPVPFTAKKMDYLPLAARYDVRWKNALGFATLGLGVSANPWFSSEVSKTTSTTNGPVTTYLRGANALQAISGSSQSSGYWVTLTPSFSQDFVLHTNWTTSLRADGQWASEPLISNEQYGLGGVNSVRGYHEGEVFGDTGWHVSLEQQTPPHVVGMIAGILPLTVRGSLFMDYGEVYLLDPQGRPERTKLWGTGMGLTTSVGPHWQSRFLVSLPLLSTGLTRSGDPYFNFVLTAQF